VKRSSDRLLTTHTGSLPRPPELQEALARFDRGEGDPPDPGSVAEAVKGIVRRQAENGVDVVNDGEMGKVSYSTYVVTRLSGFGGTSRSHVAAQELLPPQPLEPPPHPLEPPPQPLEPPPHPLEPPPQPLEPPPQLPEPPPQPLPPEPPSWWCPPVSLSE
jgi:hypothetical protein